MDIQIIRNIELKIEVNEVLRRVGMGGNSGGSLSSRKLEDLLFLVQEHVKKIGALIDPAIAYGIYKIEKIEPNVLFLENGIVLYGSLLPEILKGGKELMVSVCTVGSRLEEKVKEYLDKKDILNGIILDGIGSAAVDALVENTLSIAKKKAELKGYTTSGCICPGRKEFALDEQPKVIKLAHGEEIGVRLTPANMMIPRKSTSFVIGIGPKMEFWEQKKACQYCNLKNSCRYRSMEEE